MLGVHVDESILRRTRPDESTVIEDDHIVGDIEKIPRLVRRTDDSRSPVASIAKDLDNAADRWIIKLGQRLIEYEHIGLGDERTGERDEPLFPAAEFLRSPIGKMADGKLLKDVDYARVSLPLGPSVCRRCSRAGEPRGPGGAARSHCLRVVRRGSGCWRRCRSRQEDVVHHRLTEEL